MRLGTMRAGEAPLSRRAALVDTRRPALWVLLAWGCLLTLGPTPCPAQSAAMQGISGSAPSTADSPILAGCRTCGAGCGARDGAGCGDGSQGLFGSGPYFEAYFRLGASAPVGNGLIEDRIKTGYTIEYGLRELISCPHPSLLLFADFGGGFTRNDGQRGVVSTSGTFFAPFDDHVHPLANFLNTQLQNMQRSYFNFAVDGSYFPPALNESPTRKVSLDLRGGARTGYMRAQYLQSPSADLIDLMVEHVGHGHNPFLFEFRDNVKKADYFFGLFVSAGFGMTFIDVPLGRLTMPAITLAGEVQYGHDWLRLGAFAPRDDGLATITPMLTLAIGF